MYNQYRNTLVGKGYTPLPIRGKIPAVKKFTDTSYVPPIGFDGYNIAILCGVGELPICAIDIDITDSSVVDELVKYTTDTLSVTIQRIGQKPKTLLVYRANKPGIRKKQTHTYDKGRVEILGKGQYFVTHGTHVITHKPYTWPGTNMIHVHAAELPIISEEQIDALLVGYNDLLIKMGGRIEERVTKKEGTGEYDHNDPLCRKPPLLVQDSVVRDCLGKITPDCSRSQWILIGMALHHENMGDEKGFGLWDDWSSQGYKYEKEEMRGQWDSFGKSTVEPITMAYIIKTAKKEEVKDKKNIPIPVNAVYIPTWGNAPIGTSPLLSFQDQRILSRGSIAVVSAPAGQGKTQLVSAICAAIGQGEFDNIDTLGFTSTAKSIIYIDSEQNKWEHHNTWRKCMTRLGISEGGGTPSAVSFRLISEIEDLSMRRSFLFDTLKNDPPEIVLLDGIGDYVQDVNDSAECVSLIYKLSAIVKQQDIALLTTLHVNPAVNAEKMRGVLGSELWRKAEFSALIKRVDPKVRCLTTDYLLGKNRSGIDVLSQHFTWCDDTRMMISCAAPTTTTKRVSRETENLILDMLHTKQGSTIKRKDIATLPCSRHAIDNALQNLIDEGSIQSVKQGRINTYIIPEVDLW